MPIDIIENQTTNENPGDQPPINSDIVKERKEHGQIIFFNSSPGSPELSSAIYSGEVEIIKGQ